MRRWPSRFRWRRSGQAGVRAWRRGSCLETCHSGQRADEFCEARAGTHIAPNIKAAAMARGCPIPCTSLLRRFQWLWLFGIAPRGFDLGGLLLAKLDDMLDQADIVDPVAGFAVEIDLAMPLAGAAAAKADIRLARL